MYHLKLLLIISCLICSNFIHAQTHYANGLKYFRVQPGWGFVNIAYKEILSLDSIRNDTEYYSLSSEGLYDTSLFNYFVYNDKVFIKRLDSSNNYSLLYDFNLNTGDTFRLSMPNYSNNDIYLLVDSTGLSNIYGINYFSIYLHTLNHSKSKHIKWIKSLGNLESTLNYFYYLSIDDWYGVKAICLEDTLIYWNDSINDYTYPVPASPTCDFDSLFKFFPTYISEKKYKSLQGINIYPNPAKDYCIIEFNDIGQYYYGIYNDIGKLLLSSKLRNKNNKIDLSELNSGIFLIRVYSEQMDELGTVKLIIN